MTLRQKYVYSHIRQLYVRANETSVCSVYVVLTVVLADVVPTVCPVVLVESNCVVMHTDSCTPVDVCVVNEIR